MRRIVIRLDQPTREALGRLAVAERRQLSDQAAIIIERALKQAGVVAKREVADASTPRS